MNGDDLIRAIGIDLGGSAIKSGLVSSNGSINGFNRVTIDRMAGSEYLLENLKLEIDRLTTYAEERGLRPVGVGVGSPGSIERSTGRIQKSPNFRGWDNFPLRDRLVKMTSLPVYLSNDVNAAAMGELKFGAGSDFSNFIMITLGTGVGGALVVHGRLYDGAEGFAGEIGHMVIAPDGPACPCGNNGCLEQFVGAPALVNRARVLLKKIDLTGPLARMDPEEITAEEIGLAAADGDPVARAVLAEMGRWLGIALISLINVLDPDCILVGGGIAQAGPPLFDVIRRTVGNHAMSGNAKVVPIITAALGPRAGTAGAGALALWPELTSSG
ncbi:ROK family protein [Gemmatimonadota bacterium]